MGPRNGKAAKINQNGFIIIVAIALVLCGSTMAADWPTYGHDISGSRLSTENLQLPLYEQWRHVPKHAPSPAWGEPAINNYWHRLSDLNPAVTYDRAFHVVVKEDKAYFGSSSDDQVYCLDTNTGKTVWTFFTEGPVRLAPTVVAEKVYVGSDDGAVYCLDSKSGKLVWKYRPTEEDKRIPGNGRIISVWPIRTGISVDGGAAYFCAGLFPMQGAWLCAVDTETGKSIWKQKIDISPQGYILASKDRLYVPTGRTGPAVFDRATGKPAGNIAGPGGTFALLTDESLVSGPGRGTGQLGISSVTSKSNVATFNGLRMVINGDMAYMQGRQDFTAMDRTRYLELTDQIRITNARRTEIEKRLKSLDKDKENYKAFAAQVNKLKEKTAQLNEQTKKCVLWKNSLQYPYSLIMAGDTIFAGGDNKVAAINPADGKEIWTAKIEGKVWGISVANGKLFASTDKGTIHCFGGKSTSKPNIISSGNINPQSIPSLLAVDAKQIIDSTSITQGYCLVLNPANGQMAYELAARSELKIICVEKDAEKISSLRKRFDHSDLYGRVVVHHITSDKLPYASYFANLIVNAETGTAKADLSEISRLLRPEGGVAYLKPFESSSKPKLLRWARSNSEEGIEIINYMGPWVAIRRGALAGSGEWTHQHADPANTACSGDDLVKGDMAIQWFGDPGPREMIDRHHRNVAPLYKDGRVFVPGDGVVWAVDAYNGTINWRQDIPNSRRLGVFLDSGNMVVDDQNLFIAADDKCYGFDVATGKNNITHAMPQLIPDQKRNWGYIAYTGDLLFGSAAKPNASYQETSYAADSSLWYRNMKVVTSDYLFAMDRNNGDKKWTYTDGVILNTTITIGNGRVYFIESTGSHAKSDTLGRMPIRKLFADGSQNLVALNAQTGKVIYKKQIDKSKITEPVYLNYADELVLFSGSTLTENHVHYYYYAYNAANGDILWQADHNSELRTDGGHGEYNRHPTIIGDTIYAWPYAYELKTGKQISGWKFNRLGHGCGGVSASTHAMFWRGLNPWIYNLGPDGGPERMNNATRPGCWINIIPAGGLVLIPEASSGCTCGYSIQTSIAYRPVN